MPKNTGINVSVNLENNKIFIELLNVLKEVVNDKRIVRSVREKYDNKCRLIADKAHKESRTKSEECSNNNKRVVEDGAIS